ncbi:MAG: tyrosine-protein phosphatase, partial [Bacteroidota bacterium]
YILLIEFTVNVMKSGLLIRLILPAFLMMLISCGDYERNTPPEMSLVEKAGLSRNEASDKLQFYTKYAYLEIFSLNDSLTLGKKIEFSDSNELLMYPGNEQNMFVAASPQDTFFIAERYIDIDGALNMRDLGGLFTQDGYQVKWGKLFRSGSIAEISQDDYQRLIPLGISTICDFRTVAEAEESSDQWPGLDQISHFHIPVGEGKGLKDGFINKINSPDFQAAKVMMEMNRSYVEDYSEEYKQFFRLLLEDENYPLLFHCTAGKDRTGFASALILSALGVSREDIMDEYLMSNYYLHDNSEEILKKAALFLGMSHQKLRGIMEVRTEYLQAAFTSIEEKYGSVENYLDEELNIGPLEIEQLKETLLYKYELDTRLTSL